MRFNNSDFVHLHCHTEYSRFDGLSKIADLTLYARQIGFRALAITDHGNVGGWMKFYQECRRKKDKDDNFLLDAKGNPLPPIKPIFGQEFYLARAQEEKNPDGRKGNRHMVLLAKNQKGYQNLCALSQKAFTDGQYIDPRIDLPLLAQYSEGIICTSACLGSVVNINLLMGRYHQAKRVATLLKDIFGRDFFLEVMFHGIDEEGVVVPEIIKLGRELDIPVIATNDCHYCRKEQAKSQEVLMAISSSKCIKDKRRLRFPYGEFYVKSAEEMAKLFGTHPEVLYNTVAVSERVEEYLKTGGMRLPVFDLETAKKDAIAGGLDDRATRDAQKANTPYEFLEALAGHGMRKFNWDQSADHVAALKKELGDVQVAWRANRMDFSTYFLIVWDYIRFAKSQGILTGGGRGSGYASVLLRTLGITYGPDPLKHGLLWERFLGFDDRYFVSDDDWGFDTVEEVVLEGGEDEEDESRVVEEDAGGVDRY